MTAQFSEKLILRGEQVSLRSEPLDQFFALTGRRPKFVVNCTALWRGYVGKWEILNDRLYLIGISASISANPNSVPAEAVYINGFSGAVHKAPATLANLFPDHPNRVFAHWFTGQLRIPRGEVLNYVHGGYMSIYERDIFIDVSRGLVTGEREVTNGHKAQSGSGDQK